MALCFVIMSVCFYFVDSVKPTPRPTLRPTPNPTFSPLPNQRLCTYKNHPNSWCYDIDLYPLIGTETNKTVIIRNNDDYQDTYFEIIFTVYDNHCVKPLILFSFEEIDFASSTQEHIKLYDNKANLIETCTGTQDSNCGVWIDCFLAPQSLNVDTINKGDIYTIVVEESLGVNALCSHSLSINAQLTIICSADSVAPTISPTMSPTLATFDPTSSPTLNPTFDPTFDPTFNPTSTTAHPSLLTPNPSVDPTQIPTFTPTIEPTSMPTFAPTKARTAAPTNKPSTSKPSLIPTISPTEAILVIIPEIVSPTIARTKSTTLDELTTTIYSSQVNMNDGAKTSFTGNVASLSVIVLPAMLIIVCCLCCCIIFCFVKMMNLSILDNDDDTQIRTLDNDDEFMDFVTHTVELPEYYDLFIAKGYNSIEDIMNIKDKFELQNIGITLKGHQTLILSQIQQLQQQNKKKKKNVARKFKHYAKRRKLSTERKAQKHVQTVQLPMLQLDEETHIEVDFLPEANPKCMGENTHVVSMISGKITNEGSDDEEVNEHERIETFEGVADGQNNKAVWESMLDKVRVQFKKEEIEREQIETDSEIEAEDSLDAIYVKEEEEDGNDAMYNEQDENFGVVVFETTKYEENDKDDPPNASDLKHWETLNDDDDENSDKEN